MSKVVPFQKAEPGPSDAADVFDMSSMSDGAMDLASLSSGTSGNAPRAARAGDGQRDAMLAHSDWSNQELASLYRAQRLLSLTGVAFQTDRGLSDEGDPWFIFLDAHDQVLAHFSRIDGLYWLDSVAQAAVITSFSLDGLVSGFAQKGQAVETSGGGSNNRVLFMPGQARNTNVMVHPGAALAALIWSVYLLADDLILPSFEAAASLASDAGPAATEVSALALDAGLTDAVTDDAQGDAAAAQAVAEYAVQDDDLREANGTTGSSVFGVSNGFALNAIGLGLTTLAMSYGIQLLQLPRVALAPLQDGSDPANTSADASLASSPFWSDVEVLLIDVAAAVTALANSGTDDPATSGADDAVNPFEAFLAHVIEQVPGLNPAIVAADLPVAEDTSVVAADITDVPADVLVATADADVDIQVDASATAALVDVAYSDALAAQDFFFDLVSVSVLETSEIREQISVATVEVADASATSLVSLGSTGTVAMPEPDLVAEPAVVVATEPQDTPLFGANLPLFNDEAYDFILFMMSKEDAMRRTNFDDEVILVDIDAFEQPGAVLYARSWTFEDGSVISTLGLKSDFEAFDLVV